MVIFTQSSISETQAFVATMKMLTALVQLLLVALAILAVGVSGRMAGRLPGGFGQLPSDFSCNDRPFGYYADVDHGCRAFHVCMPVYDEDGVVRLSLVRASLTPLDTFTVLII